MATPTRVKVDKLLRYASVDREIRQENPNYKTIGCIRVKREQASFVLRREMETYGVGNVSSAYRTTCTSCSGWSDVLKTGATQTVSTWNDGNVTIRHTGQCVDCGEDWDVGATSYDIRTVFAFAAALLCAGRSRRRRGVADVNVAVGPDAGHRHLSTIGFVLASSSSPDSPSAVCCWIVIVSQCV